MNARATLTLIVAAALLLGVPALAQTDIEQLPSWGGVTADQIGAGAAGKAADVPQLGAADAGDPTRIESIVPQGVADPWIEQPQGGHDLCNPNVPESVRRRASVDCAIALPADGQGQREGLAETPLPERDALENEFESLGLDEDVPPTVILQQ